MADVTAQLRDIENLLTSVAEIASNTTTAVAEQTNVFDLVQDRHKKLLSARFFVTQHLLKVSQVHIAVTVPLVHSIILDVMAGGASRNVTNEQTIIGDFDRIIDQISTLGFCSGTHGSDEGWNEPPKTETT